jgi:hypothetical protein
MSRYNETSHALQQVPPVALGIIEQGLSLAQISSYPRSFGIKRNQCLITGRKDLSVRGCSPTKTLPTGEVWSSRTRDTNPNRASAIRFLGQWP